MSLGTQINLPPIIYKIGGFDNDGDKLNVFRRDGRENDYTKLFDMMWAISVDKSNTALFFKPSNFQDLIDIFDSMYKDKRERSPISPKTQAYWASRNMSSAVNVGIFANEKKAYTHGYIYNKYAKP